MFQDFLNGGKWCRGGNWKCCWGEFFYPPRWWQPGGVILAIRTFFKTKKQHSVNTEHQLKSKLAWPVCQKSMKLKQIEWGELAFGREGIKNLVEGESTESTGGGGWTNLWLVGGLPSPCQPQYGKHFIFSQNVEKQKRWNCNTFFSQICQFLSFQCSRRSQNFS